MEYITDNFKKTYSEPIYSKDLSKYGQILCVELSQYEWSQDVVLLGFNQRILLCQLKYTMNTVELEIISNFLYPTKCINLNISPETNLNNLVKRVAFCASGPDYKIRVYNSDLGATDDINTCRILSGHSNYINDVKFDTENKYIASVGDDNALRIWECSSFKCISNITLSSPGMSLHWHKNDTSKLLVAEKLGLIKLFNVEASRQILSLDTTKPLQFCHWCPSNNQLVCSVQMGELAIWDLSVPSMPKYSVLLFTENGGSVKFSGLNELIGSLNNLEGTLKVCKLGSSQQIIFSTTVNLPSNFCWHFKYPIICLGDRKSVV